MKIVIYNQKDLKKSGGFKVKNNSIEMNEEDFINYVKSNDLTLSKEYIDIKGHISNGKMFRCFYKDLIVGVTSIIDKCKELEGKKEQ